eukprot:scaffold949_cov186-Alexandrium_tamarense.AAC.11
MAVLQTIQEEIISSHSDRLLPLFLPHCFNIDDDDVNDDDQHIDIHDLAATIVLRRLQNAFHGIGGVTCTFLKDLGMFAAYQDGSVKWNQSCVSIVKRTDDFLDVMVLADGALFRVESSDVERHFKPPLCQPHYSFVYGNDPERIPLSLDYPASFK